jgi:hypothetical protein
MTKQVQFMTVLSIDSRVLGRTKYAMCLDKGWLIGQLRRGQYAVAIPVGIEWKNPQFLIILHERGEYILVPYGTSQYDYLELTRCLKRIIFS